MRYIFELITVMPVQGLFAMHSWTFSLSAHWPRWQIANDTLGHKPSPFRRKIDWCSVVLLPEGEGGATRAGHRQHEGPDTSSTRAGWRTHGPWADVLTIDKTIPTAGCAEAKGKDAFVAAQCVHWLPMSVPRSTRRLKTALYACIGLLVTASGCETSGDRGWACCP